MILTILYIVSALDAVSFAMVISLMTPYMLSLGGSQLHMGALGSTCAFISLIWNPIVGSLSDTLGRKKVLLQCLFICFVANFINTLSATLTVFFVSRILCALGTQIATLVKSLIDDHIKSKEDKMRAINKVQAMGGVSFILGSLISGQMSEWENGIQKVFYLISAMFVLNFGLISFIKETHTKKTHQDQPRNFNIFKEIITAMKNLSTINWSKYWDLLLIKLITDFTFIIFQFGFALTLTKTFGLNMKQFSYMFASLIVIKIVATLGMLKVKKIFLDDSGLQRLLLGIIFLSLGCLGLGLAPSFVCYVCSLIPLSIGRAFLETTITEVLLLRASPQDKGSLMGTFDSTMSLVGLVGPLFSGVISSVWGENSALLFCCIPLAFGALLTYNQKKKLP